MIALSVLILTVLGMIFEKQLGLPIAIVGSIGALSLIVTRVITEKQAYQAIDSQTIFPLRRHSGISKSAGNHRRWRHYGALNYRVIRPAGVAFLTFERRIGNLLRVNQFHVEYGNRRFINADWPVYCSFYGRRSSGGVNGDCYRLFMCLRNAGGHPG